MLHRTSSAIVHCLKRASECERLAKKAIDPDARANFFRIAEHWRSLAENRQYLDRMEACLAAHDEEPPRVLIKRYGGWKD